MPAARFECCREDVSDNQLTGSTTPLTFELLSFLALLIVQHESLEVLLFDLVLHLRGASLYGERGLRRNSNLTGLSGFTVSRCTDSTKE